MRRGPVLLRWSLERAGSIPCHVFRVSLLLLRYLSLTRPSQVSGHSRRGCILSLPPCSTCSREIIDYWYFASCSRSCMYNDDEPLPERSANRQTRGKPGDSSVQPVRCGRSPGRRRRLGGRSFQDTSKGARAHERSVVNRKQADIPSTGTGGVIGWTRGIMYKRTIYFSQIVLFHVGSSSSNNRRKDVS